MAAVSVVGDREFSGERGNRVGFGPEALGLLGVVLEHLRAFQAVRVARDHRGSEVGGRGAGALEDRVGDLLTVDRTREGGTAQLPLLPGEVLEALRDGE